MDSLYMTDRRAYHNEVHRELLELGFAWRECLLGEQAHGRKVDRYYWKNEMDELEKVGER